MEKEMRLDYEALPPMPKKHNHIFLKLFVTALVVGISFRLLFSCSTGFFPFSDDANDGKSPKDTGTSHILIPEMVLHVEEQDSHKESCDLFTGKWIPNLSGPAYTNLSCPFIEDPQNCMKNGRPDSGYLHWRWKPQGCDVPLFDAKKFLDTMQNKSWALVGDSISRNHVQSLVCLLSQVEEAVLVYHDKDYKSRTWRFSSYNFTLADIWAPFLAKADIFENDDGKSKYDIQLYLDTLDSKWTSQYHNFDYIVISGGEWFLKTAIYWENNKVVGCHNCPGKNLTELGLDFAYRKVLFLVLRFLATSNYKGLVLFRTWTPDHFENGEWFSGGSCNRTVPFKEGEISLDDSDQLMKSIELEEYVEAATIGSKNGVNLKLLDITHLSLLRPDGHPGPYRTFHPFDKDKNAKVQNDCLHWCLPGPIESWNDLIMEMVLKG